MVLVTPSAPPRPALAKGDASAPEAALDRGEPAAPESPRADPGSKRLLWLVGAALLALFVAFIAIGRWRGHVLWQTFRDAAAVAQAESDAREPARPVLWGKAHEGRAWPHYERAFALLSTPPDNGYLAYLCRLEGWRLAGVTKTEPPRKGPTAAEAIAEHAPALAALRAGAHSTDGRRPMTWSAGFSHRVLNLLTPRQLATAGVLTAIRAAADGDGQTAVQSLLDVLQLGRDLLQSPQTIEEMIGCAVLDIGTWEAMEWANLLRHLDADALHAFAAGLARLDTALPLGAHSIAGEAVQLVHHRFDPADIDHDLLRGQVMATWRYGFSARLALAHHGLGQLQLATRLQALSSGHHTLDIAAVGRVFAEAAASPNPVTAWLNPNRNSALMNRLRTVASLRLLRMAVQHALGADVVPLPDPSGGMLQWSLDAQGDAEFWSDQHRKLPRLRVPK